MWPDMRGHIWREGGGRRERTGARANLVGQARGGQEPRREREGKGDDDAFLSPLLLYKRLSPQLSRQPSLSPIPRLFAMAGRSSAGPTAALMRAEWRGLLRSPPPPPWRCHLTYVVVDRRQQTKRTGAEEEAPPRAAAFCPERRRARWCLAPCPCPCACVLLLVPRAIACLQRHGPRREASCLHISCGLPPRGTTVPRIVGEILRDSES